MITQIRVFGGVVGVVIGRVAQASYLSKHLANIVAPGVLTAINSSLVEINNLSPEVAIAVREAYGASFNWQFRILTYIAAVNVLITLFTFRRKPISFEMAQQREVEETMNQNLRANADIELSSGQK